MNIATTCGYQFSIIEHSYDVAISMGYLQYPTFSHLMEGFQVEKQTNNQEWDLRLHYQGPKVSQLNCPVVSQWFTIAIYQHSLN